jgi:hypothetical protein
MYGSVQENSQIGFGCGQCEINFVVVHPAPDAAASDLVGKHQGNLLHDAGFPGKAVPGSIVGAGGCNADFAAGAPAQDWAICYERGFRPAPSGGYSGTYARRTGPDDNYLEVQSGFS